MPPLYFLHGFLGDPKDWDGIIAAFPGAQALSYPFQIPANGILVGYSMGGRIALRHSNPKVVIGAHFGLTEGHAERRRQENQWISLLKTAPLPDFLRQWYAQPLFDCLRAHPNFPQIFERRSKQNPATLLHQLEHNRLSDQPRLTPQNALLLYGEKDLKYKNLYSSFNGISIERSGHACHLENPQASIQAIRSFVESIGKL